eukprot:6644250-Heterocapsa_arctica.AAC.1
MAGARRSHLLPAGSDDTPPPGVLASGPHCAERVDAVPGGTQMRCEGGVSCACKRRSQPRQGHLHR